MTRPARLLVATHVAVSACATASVNPAPAAYGKLKLKLTAQAHGRRLTRIKRRTDRIG